MESIMPHEINMKDQTCPVWTSHKIRLYGRELLTPFLVEDKDYNPNDDDGHDECASDNIQGNVCKHTQQKHNVLRTGIHQKIKARVWQGSDIWKLFRQGPSLHSWAQCQWWLFRNVLYQIQKRRMLVHLVDASRIDKYFWVWILNLMPTVLTSALFQLMTMPPVFTPYLLWVINTWKTPLARHSRSHCVAPCPAVTEKMGAMFLRHSLVCPEIKLYIWTSVALSLLCQVIRNSFRHGRVGW